MPGTPCEGRALSPSRSTSSCSAASFSPPVKHWDVWGAMYPCIIKAGPLRVINTLQKSSNVLSQSPWNGHLQTFVHAWSAWNKNTPMCPCLQACILHTHGSCTCPSSSTGLRKAIHEQQALLTTLVPLQWQAQNIRVEDTHTHTHAHIDIDGERRGQGRKKWGEKRGREHCNTREAEDKIYCKIQNTYRIKAPFALSAHPSICLSICFSIFQFCISYLLRERMEALSETSSEMSFGETVGRRGGNEWMCSQRRISPPSPFKRHTYMSRQTHI